VGFPIRKFTDQSLFAAPHDLSQRTTSFIASQRQGIHRIPLRHLIALIANARRSAMPRTGTSPVPAQNTRQFDSAVYGPSLLCRGKGWRWTSKDQFCFKRIREPCGQAKPTTEMLESEDRGRKNRGRIAPPSVIRRPYSGSTECVSSSRCHRRMTEDGRQRTDNRHLLAFVNPTQSASRALRN
jgi:hypothetical protein